MSSKDSIFGVKSKCFAHISQDNRLHLWDIDTRKERKGYVDKNHLSHTFTCFGWKKCQKDKLGDFVVGFSDGTVVIWDLTRGVISKTIGKVNESPSPTDIAFSNQHNSIFVSSNNNIVVQYNMSSGDIEKSIKVGKKGILKLASNPKKNILAVASSSIRVVDVESEQTKKLEGSFSGGVSALAFSTCGHYLAAASANSREILLFDTDLDSDTSAPIQVIPVNGVVTAIDTKTYKDKHVEFLVLFEEANGCVFRFSTNYKENSISGVNSLLSVTHIESGDAQLSAGYIGNQKGDSDGKGIMLAVGKMSHPLFVHAEVEDENGHALKTIQISSQAQSSKKAEVGSNGHSSANTLYQDPEVLGPHEMGGTKRPIVETTSDINSSSNSNKKSKKNGDVLIETADGELTMEQRLEGLSRNLQLLEEAAERPLNASLPNTQTPTADSLVVLVDQALQSGDDALLEQCLIVSDSDVVEATSRRLPTGRIVMFLRKLVAKFEKRPSRGLLLTRWLSSIMRHHTSFLVTVPDLSFQLAGLSQMLEQRLSSYSRLSSLSGRLDLLLSQVSYQQQQDGALTKRKPEPIVPLSEYQEE